MFFRFDWLKIKTQSETIMVTFHPKLSADETFDIKDEERCSYNPSQKIVRPVYEIE